MAGREPDFQGLARGVQLRIALKLLSKIQQAFIKKSRGEVSDDGITWPPLLRSTVANRRPAPRKKFGERPRGLLTNKQDAAWRKKYCQMLAMLRAKNVSEDNARKLAAQMAWRFVIDKLGAQTKLDKYGDRKVDIGRDTGRMLRSLTPGVESTDSFVGPSEQIVEVPPGAVIVGSNVPYFVPFHKKRPVWPEQLPEAWWKAITDAANRGLLQAAKKVLEARR